MEDFRLRVFLTAAREKSFSKAGKILYISQPAISRHIRELEASLGFPLFRRLGNKITLTRQGEIYYQQAKKVEIAYQNLAMVSSDLNHSPQATLRLGASTTIAQYLIPQHLALYLNRYPGITCFLTNGNTEEIEHLLQNDKIDLGLVEGAHHLPGLTYTSFREDKLQVICHSSLQDKFPKELSIEQIADFPLVLREHGSGTLEVFVRWLNNKGYHLSDMRVVMHLGSSESIKRFLRHHPALAIISHEAVKEELTRNELVAIPLNENPISRKFNIVHAEGPTQGIVKNFIRYLMHVE
ncbi:MAG: LysR family transcriptional regulator [Bacteroidota bacterium]